MRDDCPVCRAEGFTAHTRLNVSANNKTIIATLTLVTSDLLAPGEASLSENAFARLGAEDGDTVSLAYAKPVDSLAEIRGRIYGKTIGPAGFEKILTDIVSDRYSDIYLSAFITACAARPLETEEIISLTSGMVNTGERVHWPQPLIVDKHCVGGLPGNRTTPIVVSIAAACGLTIPKTSSRAITSPAGTADMMETLAPVELDVKAMRRVVDKEGGCVIWGGAVDLSPADDILIRVERALDLDSEGQLIASVLSKKIAAGSNCIVIDIPIGETAKIRNQTQAASLARNMERVAEHFGIKLNIIMSDGSQPIGRGIGPALEAFDVLAVLGGETNAPEDLRAHALTLAGALLELSGRTLPNKGREMALKTLESGEALAKFQAICEAQGGMREPPKARFKHSIEAPKAGQVLAIDNRRLATAARLAGAPEAKAAGLEIHVKLGDEVEAGQPLFTLHGQARGELDYSLAFIAAHPPIIGIE